MNISDFEKAYDEYYNNLVAEKGWKYCMAHCTGIAVLDYDSVMEDINDTEKMETLSLVFRFVYIIKDKKRIPFICNNKIVYEGD